MLYSKLKPKLHDDDTHIHPKIIMSSFKRMVSSFLRISKYSKNLLTDYLFNQTIDVIYDTNRRLKPKSVSSSHKVKREESIEQLSFHSALILRLQEVS
jgi:hypothetical protein